MGVKAFLASQDANFISLHEVITRMMGTDDSSYQEAAAALHRLLWAEDEESRPRWKVQDALYGTRYSSNIDQDYAWTCLRHAVQSGYPNEWTDFEDDIPF